jgi:GTP pyrophosphokinase
MKDVEKNAVTKNSSENKISKEEQERRAILRQYRRLIEVWNTEKTVQAQWEVRKAFRIAAEAHKDMRRKSGEPFIFHPIAVATITAAEIGLGKTSIISALLHDTVEDTDMTLEDIENMFGSKVAQIINGLTKIEGISETSTTSSQSETIKKVLLTLSDDVRVILIKIADRLHNMRTLDSMPRLKQLKIASETMFIYAPLAHRLGLYNIKVELEELSFKFSKPDVFNQIKHNISKQRPKLLRRYDVFKAPIEKYFKNINKKVEIRLREKSAYSLWRNMKENDMEFRDIYLTPTIEIIADTHQDTEILECWSVYASLTKIYKSNSSRLVDILSQPKANGYAAIHTTFMSPGGYWVNVQIRSRRMDEIAKRGYAAYWKYKDKNDDDGLESWLERTKEVLLNSDEDAIPFIDSFRRDLFSEEIYVYTPKGEIITLPSGSTVLDFAYAIHTQVGHKSIGAKVNHKLVSVDHKLSTGDQVEVLTSKKHKPSEKQLQFVVTTRAKSNIKKAIRSERRKYEKEGKRFLENICKELKGDYKLCDLKVLCSRFNVYDPIDFYYYLATGKIGIKDIKNILSPQIKKTTWYNKIPFMLPGSFSFSKKSSNKNIINEDISKNTEPVTEINYVVASCCNPIPNDDVVSIKQPGKPLEIHRTECSEAIKLMSQYGKRVSNPDWGKGDNLAFLTGIKVNAKNEKGLIKELSTIISDEFNINIHKFNLETIGEMIQADIQLYVKNLDMLNKLLKRIKKMKPVINAVRLNKF